MIKTILMACWFAVAAVGGNYGYAWWQNRRADAASVQPKAALEVRKLKELNVPTIRDGVVKGYVVVKVSYVVDAEKMAAIGLSPDPFVSDEVLTYLYGDATIDYNRIDRYDLTKFKSSVLKAVNARLRADVVSDVTVQEFTFMRPPDSKQ